MRPVLRPGLRLLRRDTSSIQLGLDWPGLTVIHDSPTVRAVLSAIDGFRDSAGVIGAAAAAGHESVECAHVLAALVECGAVVDADVRRDADVAESTWAAWSLLAGPQRQAGAIAARRRRRRVGVIGAGALADRVRDLVTSSHVQPVDDPPSADLLVVASDSEHDRDTSDQLMHRSVPHLWVCLRDLVGVIGPFVLPGRSACLRCVDLARAELDPAWPTLLDAVAARPLRPAPADPVSTTVVAALAVHELALWASGIEPQTCAHVVEVPYGTGSVESVPTTQHPRCGCSWLEWHDTMGA